MSRIDAAITDIAKALADLDVHDRAHRTAIFAKSIESIVNYAISEYKVARYAGIRDDLLRVAQIQAMSRKAM